MKFSVPPEGDDITDHIERYRDELPFSDQLPTFDPPMHTDHRSLMMRLITPKRLNENEEFMWRLADRQLDAILAAGGRCEFLHDYAEPFTLLVIADLEGVPEADHGLFRDRLSTLPGAAVGEHKPLEFLYDKFTEYIEDRRREPPGRRDERPSPPPPSRTGRRPRSRTPPSSPPTSSPAARRPPSASCRSPCGCWATAPTCRPRCGRTAA